MILVSTHSHYNIHNHRLICYHEKSKYHSNKSLVLWRRIFKIISRTKCLSTRTVNLFYWTMRCWFHVWQEGVFSPSKFITFLFDECFTDGKQKVSTDYFCQISITVNVYEILMMIFLRPSIRSGVIGIVAIWLILIFIRFESSYNSSEAFINCQTGWDKSKHHKRK